MSDGICRSDSFRKYPKPFVKWAGGKGQILDELLARVPAQYNTYFEPFLGGGALFFSLLPRKAVLNDKNEELMNGYMVIQSQVEALIQSIKGHVNSKKHYYKVREVDPVSLNPVERAARFIYLNKTCYNGLWRVNKEGKFNVPFGRYKNPLICDEENLRLVAAALKDVTLLCQDFECALESARAGDFVYFDPPYYPLSDTACFTMYVEAGFGPSEQERLARVFERLSRMGVFVMLSNSDTEYIRDLYRGFRIEVVQAPRAINCRKDRRGPVSELIIRNY